MGKGIIKANLGDGRYQVELQLARERAEAKIASLNAQADALLDEIVAMEDGVAKELAMLRYFSVLSRAQTVAKYLPENPTVTAYCVDLTTGLDVDQVVGTIEVPGERGTVHIAPGGAYSAAEHGQLSPVVNMTAEAAAHSIALLPGWQKWMPTHRHGVIVSVYPYVPNEIYYPAKAAYDAAIDGIEAQIASATEDIASLVAEISSLNASVRQANALLAALDPDDVMAAVYRQQILSERAQIRQKERQVAELEESVLSYGDQVYRYEALIAGLDGDACSLTVDNATSSLTGANINQSATIDPAKIDYMQCDGGAFEAGDQVIIAFEAFRWGRPRVIGYNGAPNGCARILVMVRHRIVDVYQDAEDAYVTVFDPYTNQLADIPAAGGGAQSFPCRYSDLSHWATGRSQISGQSLGQTVNDIELFGEYDDNFDDRCDCLQSEYAEPDDFLCGVRSGLVEYVDDRWPDLGASTWSGYEERRAGWERSSPAAGQRCCCWVNFDRHSEWTIQAVGWDNCPYPSADLSMGGHSSRVVTRLDREDDYSVVTRNADSGSDDECQSIFGFWPCDYDHEETVENGDYVNFRTTTPNGVLFDRERDDWNRMYKNGGGGHASDDFLAWAISGVEIQMDPDGPVNENFSLASENDVFVHASLQWFGDGDAMTNDPFALGQHDAFAGAIRDAIYQSYLHGAYVLDGDTGPKKFLNQYNLTFYVLA